MIQESRGHLYRRTQSCWLRLWEGLGSREAPTVEDPKQSTSSREKEISLRTRNLLTLRFFFSWSFKEVFGSLNSIFGGRAPFLSIKTLFKRPARPLQASKWPMLDLIDPMYRSDCLSMPSQKTLEIEPTSALSPKSRCVSIAPRIVIQNSYAIILWMTTAFGFLWLVW